MTILWDQPAIESDDGTHRYWLSREIAPNAWTRREKLVVFIMLNPSTADATQDDPTIRRCKRFANRESATRLGVVNLWPHRATDPKELTTYRDLGSIPNVPYLRGAIIEADVLIAAWGAGAERVARMHPVPQVLAYATEARKRVWCLGTTKSGTPRHPLYVRADHPLESYPPDR